MRIPKPWYRKSEGRYYVQIGKRQFCLGKDEKEAYEKYSQLMIEQGTTAPQRPFKVAQICDLFLDWSSRNNKPDTYEWYRRFLQDFCRKHGMISVEHLKPFHVNRWLDGHATWGSTSRRAGISGVKRALNWATDEGLIKENPIQRVKKPQMQRREAVLSEDDLKSIRAAIRDEPFQNFISAMQETGCRPGEVAAVTADEVDLEQGIWALQTHKTHHKTGEPRIVYLTQSMIDLSRKLMEKHPTGPIFRNLRGKPWNRNSIRCRFRRLRKKLDLDRGVVAYSLRHTFATDALIRGVDPISLCELLGHSDANMLMKHYQHLAKKKDHLRRAAERAVDASA